MRSSETFLEPMSNPQLYLMEDNGLMKMIFKRLLAFCVQIGLHKGQKWKSLRRLFQNTVEQKYAVAVNSGTSALHIACLAAGVKEGDEVVTSPNTFVASANCVIYCAAKPVFADIDPKTYNVATEEIKKKITTRTSAVIPVHFAGQSCDMESIYKVIKNKEKEFSNRIFIIEDASHALGSLYKDKHVGSCVFPI